LSTGANNHVKIGNYNCDEGVYFIILVVETIGEKMFEDGDHIFFSTE
jgi:hypothetical protein